MVTEEALKKPYVQQTCWEHESGKYRKILKSVLKPDLQKNFIDLNTETRQTNFIGHMAER